MEKVSFIDDHIVETISFKYINGSSRKKYEPHFTDWRVFPYTVIVCAFHSDYQCEIKNRGIFRINMRETIIVPRGVQHRMSFKNTGYLSYAHINFTVFNGIDILSFFNTPVIIPYQREYPIYKILDKLYKNRYSDRLMFPVRKMFAFKELGFSLLNVILKNSTEKENLNFFLSKITGILPVLTFVQENMEKKINRKTLANQLSLSETRFHYIFKEIMKISPMHYLRNVRFQKAHILLTTTDMPVHEISSMVGYADCFNFSKQFKNYFGESPLAVRKSVKKNYPVVFNK